MPYTTPTPSTVSAGDTFPASAYNIISADLQDHETRIKTGVESYTTVQKNALTGVATGTMVYDLTLGVFQSYTGSAWVNAQGSPPILTTAQKTALGTPATGTMVYDSTLGLFQVWSGSAWIVPFPALYASGSSGNLAQNATFDISWPSGFRNVTIEMDNTTWSGSPVMTFQFLNGASLLNASAYNNIYANLSTTYSGTQTTGTSGYVPIFTYGSTRMEVISPQNGGSYAYPHYRIWAGNSSTWLESGWYSVLTTVTGIRVTQTAAASAIAFSYRVTVMS